VVLSWCFVVWVEAVKMCGRAEVFLLVVLGLGYGGLGLAVL
jgi:hypothetical protein